MPRSTTFLGPARKKKIRGKNNPLRPNSATDWLCSLFLGISNKTPPLAIEQKILCLLLAALKTKSYQID